MPRKTSQVPLLLVTLTASAHLILSSTSPPAATGGHAGAGPPAVDWCRLVLRCRHRS